MVAYPRLVTNGLYFINNNRLQFLGDSGETSVVLRDFKAVDYWVVDDWVYYFYRDKTDYLTDAKNRYYKIKKDGTCLTSIN